MNAGPDRRGRRAGREPAGPGRGPRDRDRHAARRLRDRLADRVPGPRRRVHRHQRRRRWTPPSCGRCPMVADAREALDGAHDGARGRRLGGHDAGLPRADRRGEGRVGRGRSIAIARAPAAPATPTAILAQPEIIGIVNDAVGGHATVICAAGSLPGDLLKLWRPEDPKAYHLEYGYSCMGYEIAAGLGVQLADRDRARRGHGRRRLVPDAQLRDRHGGRRAAAAHDRRARQPRLPVHPRPRPRPSASATSATSCGSAIPPATGSTGAYVPIDFRQHAESMGARRRRRAHAGRDPRRARRGARPRPAHGHRRPDVARGPRARHGGLVGRAGRRGERPGQRARGARPVRAQPRAPAPRAAVTFAPRDPAAIGVAVLGAGRMGLTHLRNLAAIPNARVVVVADPIAEAAATGRDLARADRASDGPAGRDPRPGGRGRRHRHADQHPRRADRGRAPGRQGGLEREADRPGPRPRPPGSSTCGARPGSRSSSGSCAASTPATSAPRRLIDAGELGRIEQFRASSRDTYPPPLEFLLTAGGSFLDMAVHDLDLARFLVGEVEEVHAWASVLFDDRFAQADDFDTAVTMLRFRNGALGVVETARHSAWGYDIRTEVAGAVGKVVVDGGQKTPRDAPPAVRLRGRPVRELPRPVRGRLPARARGVLRGPRRRADAGARAGRRARDPAARASPRRAAGARAGRSGWTS